MKPVKKLILATAWLLVFAAPVLGQYAFVPDFFGDLYYRELANPSNAVLVGPTMNQVGASDFGPDNQFYAISGADDNLYAIDTTDGSTALIGNVLPRVGSSGQEWHVILPMETEVHSIPLT